MERSGLHDGVALPHDGHGALVEVSKRAGLGSTGRAAVNQPARVPSLLHRHLCDARERLAILIERRRIADYENVRVPGDGEIFADAHSARAVGLDVQPSTRWRWRDSRGPDHGLARDALACHDHSIPVDLIDAVAQPDFHP